MILHGAKGLRQPDITLRIRSRLAPEHSAELIWLSNYMCKQTLFEKPRARSRIRAFGICWFIDILAASVYVVLRLKGKTIVGVRSGAGAGAKTITCRFTARWLRGCGTASPTPCFVLSSVGVDISILCLECISVGKELQSCSGHFSISPATLSLCLCLRLILTQHAAILHHHNRVYISYDFIHHCLYHCLKR